MYCSRWPTTAECGRRVLRSARGLASAFRHDDPTKTADFAKYTPRKIRNFCIVAHVDHGKSTLADRLLELTGVVKPSEKKAQFLDRLQVERERGITVKAQTVALPYKGHLLNLIDTPGHADFSAEVSRSLTVCDGVLLLVAANQGVQAQTIANFWLTFERGIEMIPVINKIDLKDVKIERIEKQLKTLFEFDKEQLLKISAKSGLNVESVLEAVIERIPPPKVECNAAFQGLIFDSTFDHFRGAVAYVRVGQGSLRRGQKIRSFHNKMAYEVTEVGVMSPDMLPVAALHAGQVGYVICNMKTTKEAAVGETLFDAEATDVEPYPGFEPAKPTVYAGLFPIESAEYEGLKQAVERLSLNDPSVIVTPDSSPALGLGWRVGFLGILHMEVFSQRLEQEFGTQVILTQPSVEYRAKIKDNETIRKKRYNGQEEVRITDPGTFPEETDVDYYLEPMVKVRMLVPAEMMGVVNGLCSEARGERGEISSIDEERMLITWRLPLAEVVVNFFEQLKRLTSGYASFDYERDGFQKTRLIKLGITINGREIAEFAQIVPKAMASDRAKLLVQRLKREIPRQQFEVTIKATVGASSKALSSAIIPPWKKDFMQLLKGNIGKGGMERLNKKLSHQKKGKERMKLLGNVQVPKEAFYNVLKN